MVQYVLRIKILLSNSRKIRRENCLLGLHETSATLKNHCMRFKELKTLTPVDYLNEIKINILKLCHVQLWL